MSLCCKGLRGKGWSLKIPWHPFSRLFKHQTKQLSAINIKPIFGSVETLNPHIKTAADMYRPRETYRSSKCGIVQHSAKQCKKKQLACGRGQDKLLMRHCWMCCWGENNYVILAHHRLQQIFCPRCKNRQEEDSSTGEKNKQLFYKLFSLQLSPSLATRDINHKPPKCI